jgi:hypothetical protein
LRERGAVTAEAYVPLYYTAARPTRAIPIRAPQEGKLMERTQVLELMSTLKLCGIPGSIVAPKSIERTQTGVMIDHSP